MTRPLRCLALLAGLALASAAPAATLRAPVPYSGLYAFGDSLTDNGNAYALSFGRAPESPPYYRGRFSDGPVWYDRVAAAFREQDTETHNYAVGGAKARSDFDFIPDLRAQRRLYLDRADPAPRPLAAIWIGGNDLLDRVGRPGIRRVARAAADEVADNAASLHRNGVSSALIFNLPNLARTPRYADASPDRRRSARRGAKAFNARLASGVSALRDDGMDVIEVDVFALFAEVRSNPGAYGIDNFTEPCLRGGRNRCTRAEARASAFFDSIHPSAALHAILGDHVLDLIAPDAPATRLDAPAAAPEARIAPVPLPAPAFLLLAAFGALGVVGRVWRRGPTAR